MPFYVDIDSMDELTDNADKFDGKIIGIEGFSEEFPEATDLIKGIQLDDKQYEGLENLRVNEYEDGGEGHAVDQWIKDNPEAFDTELAD